MTEAAVQWRPTPKQAEALKSRAFEIFFGGARGGGKTDGGQAWLSYDVEHPRLRGLVIRRNAKDLTDWVDRAKYMYKPLKAGFVGSPVTIKFPSGALIRTGHLRDENAYEQYQGHEYQRMLVEEINQIPLELNYIKLLASCRSTVPDLPAQAFLTGNPGGAGHGWVKKRFKLFGTPTKAIKSVDPRSKLSRIFIPARLSDNPYLSRDPQYKAFLDGLPSGLREAWRDGSWEDLVIEGAFYTKELAQMVIDKRIGAVPYDPAIPVHTIWDFGISKGNAMSVIFFQKTETTGRIINYYENEGYGLKHYIEKLQEVSKELKYVYAQHWAPHDVTQREKSTGKTLKHTAEKLGIKFEVVPKIGVGAGIDLVRLMFPKLYISEHLEDTYLNVMKNYRQEYDEKLLKYKDTPLHDWASNGADATRYLAVIYDKITNKVTTSLPPLPKREDIPQSKYEGGIIPKRDTPDISKW